MNDICRSIKKNFMVPYFFTIEDVYEKVRKIIKNKGIEN